VRPRGQEQFGTKAEVKNLNSFRFLKHALEFEIERQIALIESGGRVVQETRLYDPDRGETFSMRSKESAHDYRYFPEPDLEPLRVGEAWLTEIKSTMPELPESRHKRFIEDYGLREYDAGVLTATRAVSDYFETAARASGDPKTAANWVMGDLAGLLKSEGKEISDSPVTAGHLGGLIKQIKDGKISGKMAKEIFPKMFANGESAETIIEREGLHQISDSSALDKILNEVLANNPKQIDQYRAGKTTVLNFLVGQVMRATRGQADVAVITQMLKQKLGPGETC